MKSQFYKNLSKLKEGISKLHSEIRFQSSFDQFDDWVDNQPKLHRKGLKYKAVRQRLNRIEELQNDDQAGTFSEDVRVQLVKNQSWFNFFKENVQIFLAEIKKENSTTLEKTWHVYHFHRNAIDAEPALARAVMKIKGKSAVFSNVRYKNNYIGEYVKKNDTLSFFLGIRDNAAKSRNKSFASVQIRVYYKDLIDDQILLGSYITYENDRIVRGSVVFEAIPNDTNAKPSVLSFKSNPKEFMEIEWSIKRYLSLKRFNYNRIRKEISDYKLLRRFVKNNVFEKWETRFFEESIPVALVAAPLLSLEPKDNTNLIVEELVDKLDNRFNKDRGDKIINIYSENKQVSIDDTNVYAPLTLRSLRRTRFFILIYTKTKNGSFSLVELGWALAHAKTVIIFYEEGAISERIKTLEAMGVQLNPFKNIEQDIGSIYEKIEMIISTNLEDYLNPIKD